MKKGILCILLAIIMIVPLFTACNNAADLTGEEVAIYTLYTIKDEQTTEEAVRQVELSLNRILFYRLGVILDLVMVTEEEYDELIEQKFTELEELELAKKDKKNNKKNSNDETSDDKSSGEDVMTGDKVLELLEEGKDIPLTEPRLDIFLVRGYDEYYELASTGQLAAIDEKLSNEAKALNSYIHSTIINAAKVDGKTYGVPVNSAIGEYTYFVFDTELMEKHKVDPKTISSLADLQKYLEAIKTSETDVVPLKNTAATTDVSFLGNDGFPAIVTEGEVMDAYSNTVLLDYFSMIARYKALGYIGDPVAEGEEDNNRYAVRIETGDKDDIAASLPNGGEGYTFSPYSAPLATNETTFENIFCVSKYVVSSDLTDVMEILTALNTDSDLMNLMTFGVEKVHYDLNDNGQVERLETTDPYIVNPEYMGNCFITYTVDGENPDKWNNYSLQNQDAVPSPALGFTLSPTKFEYEDGDKEIEVYEPDYIEIINSVVDKYYPNLMNGTAILDQIDYAALLQQVTDSVTAEYTEDLNNRYIEDKLKTEFSDKLSESITNERGPILFAEADEYVRSQYRSWVVNTLTNELTTKFTKENPDATSDQIKQMVNEALTEEYIAEGLLPHEETIVAQIQSTYEENLQNEIDAAVEDVVGSSAYNKRYEELINSDEYKNELEALLLYDAPYTIQNRVDDILGEKIAEYTDLMIADINVAIEEAVEAFIADYSEILGMTREEMLEKMEYMGVKEEEGDTATDTSDTSDTETSDSESEDGEEETEKVVLYASWFEFVFEAKIKAPYYVLHPLPTAA